MIGEDDIGPPQQGMVGLRWFLVQDIQARTTYPAVIKGCRQGSGVYDSATGSVYQYKARLDRTEGRPAYQAHGILAELYMQGNEVRPAQDLRQGRYLYTYSQGIHQRSQGAPDTALTDIRAPDQDAGRPQAHDRPAESPTRTAESDYPHGCTVYCTLGTHHIPSTAAYGSMTLGYPPGQIQHQPQGVGSYFLVTVPRDIGYRNSSGSTGCLVDIVHPHPIPGNNPAAAQAGNHQSIHGCQVQEHRIGLRTGFDYIGLAVAGGNPQFDT
jgi:hypothetical protein